VNSRKNKLTYAGAGVNIDAMAEGLRAIEQDVRSTFNESVIENVGGFGTLFRPDLSSYEEPVLVSSTDGVGTKLMVARMAGDFSTVGTDLVNHCVNDILVQGARPLYFLDYVGAGVLDPGVMAEVVSGLARGCRNNGIALIGGETAEMPGIYGGGDIDLVGCITGIVDRNSILTGASIRPGDVIVGLASSGLHTNGYSLARKLFFEVLQLNTDSRVEELGCTAGEELLKVHRSYFPALYPCLERFGIKGLAHITGGGLTDNVPRMLPSGTGVRIRSGSWEVPAVFRLIQREGDVEEDEMFRAFNMGVGMTAAVPAEQADPLVAELNTAGEKAWVLGDVVTGERKVAFDD
jgi:phosphoribosylformylglycinamidine cyclo-ligase